MGLPAAETILETNRINLVCVCVCVMGGINDIKMIDLERGQLVQTI